MSLINFLNSKLKPSVESEAICEDAYSINNLIADDVQQLNRGFMAFNVTKPPVDIFFEFPKAIDLKIIKIWNTIGSMRSTAFEIYGKIDGSYERVGYVRDVRGDSVTFCYQSDYSSRNSNQQCEKAFFFKTAHKMLSNCTSIKVVIKATQRCPPVMQKIQIWGLPSKSLDKADRELVKTIWNEVINPPGTREREKGQRSPSRNFPELCDSSQLIIPEEFLDAITWELMVFPTVLPSGKIVDQSTIDRHSEVEAKWGRLPSDPFTGLEFASHRKAILDLALKARIEKFLMENSEQFKTVPRTLGSSRVRRSKNRHASSFASDRDPSIMPCKRQKLDDSHYRPAAMPAAHSTTLASNVDSAINMALQRITRFTTKPAEIKRTTCIGCKSEDYSYEIQTCKHLVCRVCLVHLTRDQMCTCKTSFKSSDVERHHK